MLSTSARRAALFLCRNPVTIAPSNLGASEIVTGLRMLAVQCKMARVAVGWGVRELAAAAEVSPDTVARLERGEALRETTINTIRRALEKAGVEFTNGEQPGVRLRKSKPARKSKA